VYFYDETLLVDPKFKKERLMKMTTFLYEAFSGEKLKIKLIAGTSQIYGK